MPRRQSKASSAFPALIGQSGAEAKILCGDFRRKAKRAAPSKHARIIHAKNSSRPLCPRPPFQKVSKAFAGRFNIAVQSRQTIAGKTATQPANAIQRPPTQREFKRRIRHAKFEKKRNRQQRPVTNSRQRIHRRKNFRAFSNAEPLGKSDEKQRRARATNPPLRPYKRRRGL